MDASAAIKFIDGCPNAKLAIVHASLKDEVALLDFFQNLVENLKTPFAGMRVSGSATLEGYFEDAIAKAVLCGDFEVNIFHEKINLQEPMETVEKLSPNLKGGSLCIMYAAITCQQNVYADFILRRIQLAYPKMQIFGGTSSPQALVVTNDGIHGDHLLCVKINGVETDAGLTSGYRFKDKLGDFIITKSDEYYIQEINGKNAIDEYCKIQHMQPYFHNMVMRYLLSRSDISIVKSLFNASAIIREGSQSLAINLLGRTVERDKIEPLIPLDLGYEKKGNLLSQAYVIEGTKLKRIVASKEAQLAAYDELCNRFSTATALLMVSCISNKFVMDFDYVLLQERLKAVKYPLLLSFTFGEFGATLPYRGLEQNVVHGGVVKALAFK